VEGRRLQLWDVAELRRALQELGLGDRSNKNFAAR
jgi:hypothetical protein